MNFPKHFLVDVFTSTIGLGNRAGVVLDASHLTEKEMQKIASDIGVSETVFLVQTKGGFQKARFFTPLGEIDFCGHAILALGQVLKQHNQYQNSESQFHKEFVIETNVGAVPLEFEFGTQGLERVWMRQLEPGYRPAPPEARAVVAESLGIDARLLHRVLPLDIAYTGLWVLFVPLVDASLLESLEPDFGLILQLSKTWGVSGLYPYASISPNGFIGRFFAPLIGINEDPVTGSANGALAAMLARAGHLPRFGDTSELVMVQGHVLGQPGEVFVVVEYSGLKPVRVRLGGKCVVLPS